MTAEAICFDFAEPLTLDFEPAPQAEIVRFASGLLAAPAPGNFVLRDYQVDALATLREGWKQFRRQLAVMATGCGKTVIFSQCAAEEVTAGGRVLILAHTDELLDQAADKLRRSTGLEAEKEKAEHHASLFASVVVGSVQTLSRDKRLTEWPDNHFSLVIVDEAHRSLAKSYQKVLRYFHFGAASLSDDWVFPEVGTEYQTRARILGVTATADRGDKRSLGEFYERAPVDYGLLQAVRDGYLVRPIAHSIPLQIDLRGVRVSRTGQGSDYDLGELTQRITPFLREIARHIAENARDRKTVCFLPGIETARLLSEALREAGIDGQFVSGACPDRAEKIAWFHAAGNGSAICNAMLLTEGWDCLDSETEILTTDGWLTCEQIGAAWRSASVYSLNLNSGRMESVPIEDYGVRPVRDGERMFTIKSQHVDIRTTEGHRFYLKYRSQGKLSRGFLARTGTELAQRKSAYALPISAEADFGGVALSDDDLKFVAWFLTDGCFNRSAVSISQAKSFKNEIRALLSRLGFDFRERVREPQAYSTGGPVGLPLHEFEIPKGTHGGSLARRGWFGFAAWLDKDVVSELHDMTRAQFVVFWKELLKGNGSSGWLYCGRKTQADAFTQMAVLRGFATSSHEDTTANGEKVYRVGVRGRQFITSDPTDARAARMELTSPVEGESVWCVKNRNGTLVTRRNGKVVVIGNCPDASCVCVLRPTKIRSLYVQCVGRATRTLPGVIDGLATAGERLAAIAASAKPDMRILDFLWLSDNLSLVKPLDLVATKPEIRERMMVDGGTGDLVNMEESAERDLLKSLEKAAREHTNKKARVIDPLAWAVSLGDAALATWQPESRWDELPPTPGQLATLEKNGIDTSKVTTRGLATRVIARVFDRQKLGLCTPKQLNFLERLGVHDAALVSFRDASALIDARIRKQKDSARASK